MNTPIEISSLHSRIWRNLTNEQRKEIFHSLLLQIEGGKLKRGGVRKVAALFSVNEKTIRRIWSQGKACMANGLSVDVSSRIPTRVGQKRVDIDSNEFKKVDLRKRTNIRSLSKELNVPKSTLHVRIKEGKIRQHSNAIKPNLTDANKRASLCFCLSMIEPSTLRNYPVFKNMYNYVHIDEKWFYMTKDTERYYLLPEEEEEPHRTCKSKRFITKVMFLGAVARPRFDANHNEVFSGKIGIFPFTCKEPAKRNSKNRSAGTLETKAITVTKDVIRSCLIEKVLPTIRPKWPRSSPCETIFVQQDNAKPHILPSDLEFLEAANRDGLDIRLSCQPPNSPDMNVLDLGFFRAIQSLPYQEAPKTIDELVNAVQKSFDEFPSDSLNHVFLTLQSCMVEVMKVYGGNNYKVPHMGKYQLIRRGVLPSQLECGSEIVENALNHLQQQT